MRDFLLGRSKAHSLKGSELCSLCSFDINLFERQVVGFLLLSRSEGFSLLGRLEVMGDRVLPGLWFWLGNRHSLFRGIFGFSFAERALNDPFSFGDGISGAGL